MKTLNFFLAIIVCLMAISRVSATYYIIKTFENYGSKDQGDEGTLNPDGQKRVDCLVGLIGSKIQQPDAIIYKDNSSAKASEANKTNPRQMTATAIASKLNLEAQPVASENGITQALTSFNNVLFVWPDKEKAQSLAKALGVTNPPEFKKLNYGYIWAIDNGELKEVTMDCDGLQNSVSSSASTLYYSMMSVIVAILYILF
ncbi:hypothetical protein BCR32DRAFT_288722 [Anaeromyces robustus]|uniref:Uncharacterized protein n=1 Tax=Anaeromyces robustus TaxID=1754192 RepID=A0A1Y1XR38_9FUNG|nr:hypothetical protein BCR32DRAFT_288722 [Anaeromyces robustus]|eukprot:ORX88197.1 hypothetical protein BCR32DRAFT_288722 [Anaeromyces robustus]